MYQWQFLAVLKRVKTGKEIRMNYLIGDKSKIAVEVKILNNASKPEEAVRGDFYLWIKGNVFGKEEASTYITGNCWLMVEKFENPPFRVLENDFFSDEFFFKTVWGVYYGDIELNSSMSLVEKSKVYSFFEKFLLSPNGEIGFDDVQICYYKLNNEFARLLFKRIGEPELNSIDIEISYLKGISENYTLLLEKYTKQN